MKGGAMCVCAVAVAATLPAVAQDVSAALWAMCEDAEAYDPTDTEAVRANADDFCAVLLSEPRKARRQLDKMVVRNRAVLNPNRWYIDARRVPARDRPRYDGAFVQLRRSWMDGSWDIVRNANWCDDGNSSHRITCFTFTKYDDAGDQYGKFVLRRFYLQIEFRWYGDCQPRNSDQSCADDSRFFERLELFAQTLHRCPSENTDQRHIEPTVDGHVWFYLDDPSQDLDRIGELLDAQEDVAC